MRSTVRWRRRYTLKRQVRKGNNPAINILRQPESASKTQTLAAASSGSSHRTITVSVSVLVWPESSRAVNVTVCGPSGALPLIFNSNFTFVSVVVFGSFGFDLMPIAGSGGVTVTLPVNPVERFMFTVTRTVVPACAVTVGESNPSEKTVFSRIETVLLLTFVTARSRLWPRRSVPPVSRLASDCSRRPPEVDICSCDANSNLMRVPIFP